jgi:hypothetical protein
LLITFGSGSDQYSRKTPSDFNFSTTYPQRFQSPNDNGMFVFVNALPGDLSMSHQGALDYTPNDIDGYMYYVKVDKKDSQFFKYTITNLCIGQRYEFSTYLANVIKKGNNFIKPNVRFEVQAATAQNSLFAQILTNDIPEDDKLTWRKYGLSFVASDSSIVLLMISELEGGTGNDLAIDDIQLSLCSTTHSGLCPPG